MEVVFSSSTIEGPGADFHPFSGFFFILFRLFFEVGARAREHPALVFLKVVFLALFSFKLLPCVVTAVCCALQCIVIEALSIVLLHCLARGDCFFLRRRGSKVETSFF